MSKAPTHDPFTKYFLEGQEKGEVYLGEGVAMVVYPTERMVALEKREGIHTGFFIPLTQLQGLEEFSRARRPEHRRGVKKEITKDLETLAVMTSAHSENLEGWHFLLYAREKFSEKTGEVCPAIADIYLWDAGNEPDEAAANYRADFSHNKQ